MLREDRRQEEVIQSSLIDWEIALIAFKLVLRKKKKENRGACGLIDRDKRRREQTQLAMSGNEPFYLRY